MKLTFKDIEERGLLLYKYIRGSRLYNINTPESDTDEGGVYICPNSQLIDLGFDYQDEVSDEKHDTCWWELGKFFRLLLSSNPTVLESLFVPDDKVIYEHPIITEIKKHRMEFVTKKAFMPFGGYAISQIRKAQGQNKYIHWDIESMTRKTPMDFCFTFDEKQGSIPMQKWLDDRGLRQDCCGLVNVPNMPGMYGVYYDFGQHFKLAGIGSYKEIPELLAKYIIHAFKRVYQDFEDDPTAILQDFYFDNTVPIGGYCGLVRDDGKSTDIRFSETPKGSSPICCMSYNDNGYQQHCKKYGEYLEWKENRNKNRYENNLQGISDEKEKKSKFYDAKNMGHCFRLMSMCIEVAQGKGVIVDRTGIDREFLMDVRQRKYTYDELMNRLNELKSKMDDEISKSTIPDEIDIDTVNSLLLNTRKEFWAGRGE